MIKENPVAYAPSASLIQFCHNKGSGKLWSCASFGVLFEEESEDVAKLFNTKAHHQVTKNTMLRNCTNKDVIYFSFHGYFDASDPLSSSVLLHDDNASDIHMSEVMRELHQLILATERLSMTFFVYQ